MKAEVESGKAEVKPFLTSAFPPQLVCLEDSANPTLKKASARHDDQIPSRLEVAGLRFSAEGKILE
jgi:hypothetical protein